MQGAMGLVAIAEQGRQTGQHAAVLRVIYSVAATIHF